MKFTTLAPWAGAAALLAGCAAAPSAPPPPTALDIHGTWVIEQARAEPILDKRRARLVLGRDGRLSGHNSCNAMNGRFTLEGDRIRIFVQGELAVRLIEVIALREDCIRTADPRLGPPAIRVACSAPDPDVEPDEEPEPGATPRKLDGAFQSA